jgi:hypothetical protein
MKGERAEEKPASKRTENKVIKKKNKTHLKNGVKSVRYEKWRKDEKVEVGWSGFN